MENIIGFLTTKELILVYTVVIAAGLICSIIYVIDKLRIKRKLRNNTKELTELAKDLNIEIKPTVTEKENNSVKELIIEPITMEKVVEPENIVEESINVINAKESVELPVIDVLEEIIIEPIQEVKTNNVIEVGKISTEQINTEETIKIVSEPIKEEDLIYAPIEPNQTEAQAQLKKLTEELMKAEEEEKLIETTNFEAEQEENAIISLNELINKTRTLYENNELELMDDEGDEPISLADLELRKKSLLTTKEVVETIEETKAEEVIQQIIEPKQVIVEATSVPVQQVLNLENNAITKEIITEDKDNKKFVSSPIISPIYGIEPKETVTQSMMELENTANYDKLDEEIKKTNEFLMTLKELQKNLD